MSMSSTSAEDYIAVLLGSEGRADLLTLFHRNPGIIDTAEGIGRRIGLVSQAIQFDLEELTKVGVLQKKKFGNRDVFFLNQARDSEIQQAIGNHLREMKPSPIKGKEEEK